MVPSSRFRLTAAYALLLAAFPAFAFQPLITDDTGTQGSGGNQIEVSFTRDRASSPDDTTQTRVLGAVFTRGVTDTLDMFLQANRTAVHSTSSGIGSSGGGNPSFGAKWRFYEGEDNGFSLALKPEILLPVSAAKEADGLGNGRTSHGMTAILSQEVPFGAIHANLFVGHDHFRDVVANSDTRTVRASIAPVWAISEAWQLGLDTGTEEADAGGAKVRTNFVEVGAIYSPNKNTDFALGIIRSRDANGDGRTTTNSVTAGITWRF